MIFQAEWITTAENMGDICPVFRKGWKQSRPVREAKLFLSALGVYEAELNGSRVSEYVLAPGWTSYKKRLQYQEYDITGLLEEDNTLTVTVGKGWFRSRMADWAYPEDAGKRAGQPCGLIGEIHIVYEDGEEDVFLTDETWEYAQSPVRFSEIYDGEHYDARVIPREWKRAVSLAWDKDILIPQEGCEIREMERVQAKSVFCTPKGETVVDFGQEVTGYVEFTVDAAEGECIRILHGEMLDQDGNFYNENYRSAKSEIIYICGEGNQTWHPRLTFFGFRYVKLEKFPGAVGGAGKAKQCDCADGSGSADRIEPDQFTAIAVYSDIRQTGSVSTSDAGLNQLISNVFWGQKGNFLDVPTDCPQRDERLGWTGDAQVFVKTAGYNYDVERFFVKWLRDLAADQRPDGGVSTVVPDYMPGDKPSAGWGDAAVICPWQIYVTYGNAGILEEQFDSMKKWIDYITHSTKEPYLWIGGEHFGDWLGLDAPAGSYKGASREDLVASAFYAYSTGLFVKAGKVLGKDMGEYEGLHRRIIEEFRRKFPEYHTQTEHVLAAAFGLAEDPQKTADALAEMIVRDGSRMRTGFVGTPLILHVLSRYGHTDLAWTLLLRKEYPSWLFPVEHGATTIWEHWDGIMEDGSFWNADMNSFNHYSYGAVLDWIYEVAAGITPVEDAPGFEKVRIEPHPDQRVSWLEASLKTRHGLVSSKWVRESDGIRAAEESGEAADITGTGRVRYEITTEMPAVIVIEGRKMEVKPGRYTFWGN